MEENITERVTQLALQLAVILVVAKVGGEVCERYLKVSPVLGELVAGMVIGPFALGGLSIGGVGPLFLIPAGEGEAAVIIPVSIELYSLAQVAAVVLLFVSGLETDLRQFLRYVGPSALIAVGGLVLPFVLGVAGTIWFGLADGVTDPKALFVGAMMTATSVGITARLLRDIRRLDTPEGVTVMAAAVVDDVAGILLITIVVGISVTGEVSVSQVAIVGVKAIGFWLGLTGLGLLAAKYISQLLLGFRSAGATLGLTLALAFLAAGLAELFGLAMIIGAYSMGLALSDTELARRLEESLRVVYNALVPIFFVVMGMLVDPGAMQGVLLFGAGITLLAILGKVVGAGAPALLVGFNRQGAWRIGVGMLPRGEVVLFIAGMGLARGVIGPDLFGVAVMLIITTVLMAPLVMLPAFRQGGAGTRSTPSETRRTNGL